MLMLLSNKILFTGCYFVTFTSVVHFDVLCVLLFHCMHVRMPYVLIKELTYLLTYLETTPFTIATVCTQAYSK